ncbi:MAG TPA: cytochrome d ubiquinol oxidase subunit II [Flavisolibacter sp.]|nr:cytochrome d ubiquinol oxidase subunit II [Flavisolibacter sp.]
MKNKAPFILFLAFLSAISGYLMSRPSLIGRIGMDLFYKEYRFLKTWWQGGLTVFSVLLLLFLLQGYAQARLPMRKARLLHGIMILLALGGFYYTWLDFHNTATHRWLKERFHLGVYLFWLGWICSSLYYLLTKRRAAMTSIQPFINNTP